MLPRVSFGSCRHNSHGYTISSQSNPEFWYSSSTRLYNRGMPRPRINEVIRDCDSRGRVPLKHMELRSALVERGLAPSSIYHISVSNRYIFLYPCASLIHFHFILLFISSMVLKVAICGGGIGGFITALCIGKLCESNVAIEIFEQASELKVLKVSIRSDIRKLGLGFHLHQMHSMCYNLWAWIKKSAQSLRSTMALTHTFGCDSENGIHVNLS